MVGRIWIGTSGWTYDHWLGTFYPKNTRREELLAVYAERFDSVEINATFYHLPSAATVAGWKAQSPDGFLFAAKASRYLTHMKKLKDPEEPLGRFLACVEGLGERLGPLLFQLPPRWRANPERLESLLRQLPGGHRCAFEFRDRSWHDDRILQLLSDRGAASCIYDLAGERSPIEVTSDFVYLRLHGPGAPYRGSYDGRTLLGWTRRILGWSEDGKDVYCYFDNDEKGFAPHDAGRLKAMVAEHAPSAAAAKLARPGELGN